MIVILNIGIAIITLLSYLFVTLIIASAVKIITESYEDAISAAYIVGLIIYVITAMIFIHIR